MRGGHKVEGCKGKWIDLTTLSDPQRVERCATCGGIVYGRGDEPEPAEPADDEDVELEELGPVNTEGRWSLRPLFLLIGGLGLLILAGLARCAFG